MNAFETTGGIEPPSERECAPIRTDPLEGTPDPLWWVLGAHGGAAASTLAAWWGPAADAVRHWPAGAGDSPYVVIAARATMRGLTAAHALLRQHHTGGVPAHLVVIGVVVTADRPGRVPAPIRLYREKVAALAEGRLWTVDYHDDVSTMLAEELPQWQIGDAPVKRPDLRRSPPESVVAAAAAITTSILTLEYPAVMETAPVGRTR